MFSNQHITDPNQAFEEAAAHEVYVSISASESFEIRTMVCFAGRVRVVTTHGCTTARRMKRDLGLPGAVGQISAVGDAVGEVGQGLYFKGKQRAGRSLGIAIHRHGGV